MPKSRKRSGKRKNKRALNPAMLSRGPSERVIKYTGPITTPIDRLQSDLHVVLFHNIYQLTSTMAGAILDVIPSSPAGCPNWSAAASVFDEYRTLGFTLEFQPQDRYDTTLATSIQPIVTVIDQDLSSALTSYSNSAQYASAVMHNLADPFKVTARMTDITAGVFTNSSAPLSFYWIKCVATGLANSTNYGYWKVSYRVQFRGFGV